MPDLLAEAWNLPGLGWIAFAAFIGGLVRGFAGFGTALVFLPVTAQFLTPFQAILALTFMDILGPMPILRRAWPQVEKGDLGRLTLGTAVMLPVGLAVLQLVPPEAFRYAVSLLALSMLAVLIGGLRYGGVVSRAMVLAIGGAAGFLGGVAGLPGPPVILFYMARPLPAAVIRATTLYYLFVFDLLIILGMGAFGLWEAGAMVLGLGLAVPCMAGNWLGGRMFVPGQDRLYRGAAYGLIALSALSGLPFWR
ncbi:sulfite exporter TauE/SafE family protein [Tropicibacter oceani]|uniref:Probable membrane transporter protein n=1 Tax=Tropicibacter oceani TaxID=3058420 RepID=A0ABY8QF65_9RHOB|nr:sulfite exporter TauE/SafE family protein [Tropicibacter oceani]WGW03260.1 sulfite exporter TauE/SafE family protein [Tropicibacter oceani]